MPNEPLSLTNTALSRLQALAKGNAMPDGDIQMIEAKEGVFTLSGALQLAAHLDTQTRSYTGRCKTKGLTLLPSFAAFEEELKSRQKKMDEDATWVDLATAELNKMEGLGWGKHDTILIWDHKPHRIAATENCPACNGTGQHPCNECHGISYLVCHYCEGRGKEICYHCNGAKTDPVNIGKPCSVCNGTGYAICRYCQNTGQLPCPTCNGKGQTPCERCNGAGASTREAKVHTAAKLSFRIGNTTTLPSGLLRAITRIGENNLHKGHADITRSAEPAPNKKTILLEAKLPYADLKMRIGKKSGLVSCTGKQARLSGVPAFLDEALIPARRELARAAQGAIALESALKVRIFSEALQLVLSGKITANDLRRLYPVGLSGDTAQEIMRGMALALKIQSRNTRIITSVVCIFVSTGLFAGLLFTPALDSLPPVTALIIKTALPALVLALDWLALSSAARWSLKKRFPAATLKQTQTIGKTGAATLASILVLYLALIAWQVWGR